jgi:spermidine synthase
MRLFSTYYGTSEYAVTTVLASYMGGLALGAWISGRYLHRIKFPILAYGFLELLIAVSALCVPLMMKLAGLALTIVVGGQFVLPDAGGFSQPVFYIISSMIILGIPTICMGATLPILMRYVINSDQHIGNRTGLLYGINTIGADLGTLAAGFVLLPALGINNTVWLGVAVNILIYLIAIITVLAQGFSSTDRVLRRQLDLPLKTIDALKNRKWMFPLMLASGMVSFTYEVLWTRLLGHIVGGSVAAFATMLAAFLTGIALGGFLGGLVAKTKQGAIWWFVLAQLMIAVFSVAIYYKIDSLIPDIRNIKAHVGMAYSVMVPATIFIGMTFPLAVRILSDSAQQASAQAARIYTWNTCGAVIGALMAGFIIIPTLGFEGTIVLCVVANLVIASLVLFTQFSLRQIWLPAALSLALVVSAGMWRPSRPDAIIKHSLFAINSPAHIKEEFYAVGRSATVLSLSSFGEIYYRSNGLPEANVVRKGAGPVVMSQQWLGTIPSLLRPQAQNMMVVGYGGGAVLEAIPRHIQNIDVIELEREVINANRATAHLRKFDPLADPRVNIIYNDARNALQLSRKKFDIIVSQPSHPWTAGASHLFTKEYMALAKRHLNRDGVFLQWINAEFVSEQLLRDLAATLVSEFKYVRMAQISPNALHFYGSDAPLDIENDLPSVGTIIGEDPELFSAIGINSFYDILSTIVLDENGTRNFAKTGKIIRDNQNQLAVYSRQFGGGLSQNTLMSLLRPYDPFIHGTSLKVRDMHKDHALYVLGALVRLGMLNRAWDVMKSLDTTELRLLAQAAIYKANGNVPKAMKAARKVREENILDDDAMYISIYASLSSPDYQIIESDQGEVGEQLATVFELTRAGWRGDWQAVIDQDEALIQIPLTRTYAAQAMYLRAQARAQLMTDSQDLNKAMALVERSHLLEPSLSKLELRAELADRLQDGNRVVNSLWQISDWLAATNMAGNSQDLGKDRRDVIQAQLDSYESMLARISDPALVDRIAFVRSMLLRTKSKISSIQAMGSSSTR